MRLPTALLRQNHWHPCRAFATSPPPNESSQPYVLPPARLRALIALYHASSTFITPANLSTAIDRAFTNKSSESVSTTESSLPLLQERLKARRNENLVGPGRASWKGVPLDYAPGRTWSDQRGERQDRVSRALWGTEMGGRPGLETIEEVSSADEELSNRLAETADGRGS